LERAASQARRRARAGFLTWWVASPDRAFWVPSSWTVWMVRDADLFTRDLCAVAVMLRVEPDRAAIRAAARAAGGFDAPNPLG